MKILTFFINAVVLTFTSLGIYGQGRALAAEQWSVFKTSFTSEQKYENPFTEVEVDVVFRQGEKQ